MKWWYLPTFFVLFMICSVSAGFIRVTKKKPEIPVVTTQKNIITKPKNISGIPTYIEHKNFKKPRFLYDQYIYHYLAEDVDGTVLFVRKDKIYHNGSIKGALVWKYEPNVDSDKSIIYLANQRWDCNKKKQVFANELAIDVSSLEQISQDDTIWYKKDEGYPEPNTIHEMTMNYICGL